MNKQKLQQELKESMLAKDQVRTSVLRMLLSALNYYEIQKGGAGYEASDEDVMAVIQKEVKQRKDSIEQFQNAGRQELVLKEKEELEILQKYMPAQMSEDEIRTLVKDAVKQTGASTVADLGKVMGALMRKTKGKADGSLVSQIVKQELSS
jgi:uncharacterized protein